MTELGTLRFPYRLTKDYQRDALADLIKKLEVSPEKAIYVQVTDSQQKRIDDMHRLAERWYKEVAKQSKKYTAIQVKSMSKYNWAVPIMRKHDFFNERWLTLITAFPTYEKQLEILEYLPVTSLMTSTELGQYLNDFKRVMSNKYKLTKSILEGVCL